MPFRERIKRVLTRSSGSSSSERRSSKASSTATKGSSSLYYQPGEKLPLKYRRPVAKEHKEKLEAFSFAKSWRRRSHQSIYSPHGSRMPSRKNSVVSTRSGAKGRKSMTAYREPGSPVIEHADDEGDVGNVGLSRRHTREDSKREKSIVTNGTTDEDDLSKVKSNDLAANGNSEGRPFSAQDLTLALQKSQLSS